MESLESRVRAEVERVMKFGDFEARLHESLMGAEREGLSKTMTELDKGAPAVEVDGVRHVRASTNPGRYMTAAGGVEVVRWMRGAGTDAARRLRRESGSKSIARVPSEKGFLRAILMSPSGARVTRSGATAGRPVNELARAPRKIGSRRKSGRLSRGARSCRVEDEGAARDVAKSERDVTGCGQRPSRSSEQGRPGLEASQAASPLNAARVANFAAPFSSTARKRRRASIHSRTQAEACERS